MNKKILLSISLLFCFSTSYALASIIQEPTGVRLNTSDDSSLVAQFGGATNDIINFVYPETIVANRPPFNNKIVMTFDYDYKSKNCGLPPGSAVVSYAVMKKNVKMATFRVDFIRNQKNCYYDPQISKVTGPGSIQVNIDHTYANPSIIVTAHLN